MISQKRKFVYMVSGALHKIHEENMIISIKINRKAGPIWSLPLYKRETNYYNR